MARKLDIQIGLESRQADNALKSFINTLDKAEKSMKSMQETQKKTSVSLRYMQDTINKTNESFKKIGTESENAGAKTAKSFEKANSMVKSFGANLLDTSKSIAKWSLATGTIISGKALYDLKNYSEAMGFFNATVKVDSVETQKKLRDEFMKTSANIGVSVDKVIGSGQRLASSGLAPTAAKGTKEYQDQLMNLVKINELVGRSAALTGSSLQETVDGYVYMSNAMGRNPANADNAKYVLDMISAIQDYGSGDLREYNAQYSKFLLSTKQMGMSDPESLGIFTRMTKTMSPMMAGHVIKSFSSDLMDMATNAGQASNKVNFVLNKVKKGTLSLSNTELSELRKFDTTDEWNKIFFEKDKNGNMKPKALMGQLDSIRGLFKSFESEYSRDTIMSALFQNQNTKKLLLDVMVDENFKDLKQIIGDLSQKGLGTGEYSNNKWNIYEKNFSKQWNSAWESWKNFATRSLDEISPAFGAVFQAITQTLNGQSVDGGLAKGFDEARKNIAKTYPALRPVVDLLEKVFKWIESGDAGKTFEGVVTGLQAVGTLANMILSVIMKVQKFINSVGSNLGLSNGTSGLLGLGAILAGYSGLKTLMPSLGGLIIDGMGKAIGGGVGVTIGKSIATSIIGTAGWLGLAALIGAGIGAAYMSKIKEDDMMVSNSIQNLGKNYETNRNLYSSGQISKEQYLNTRNQLDNSGLKPTGDFEGGGYFPSLEVYLKKGADINKAMDVLKNNPMGITDFVSREQAPALLRRFGQLKRDEAGNDWTSREKMLDYDGATLFDTIATRIEEGNKYGEDQNKLLERQISELQNINGNLSRIGNLLPAESKSFKQFDLPFGFSSTSSSGSNITPKIGFSF